MLCVLFLLLSQENGQHNSKRFELIVECGLENLKIRTENSVKNTQLNLILLQYLAEQSVSVNLMLHFHLPVKHAIIIDYNQNRLLLIIICIRLSQIGQ